MASKQSRKRHALLLVGLGPTTLSALEALVEPFQVVGLVRERATAEQTDDPVVVRALSLGIPIFTDSSLPGIRLAVEQTHPEAVVVSSYNRLLPADLLRLSTFVNVHYAPLPRYRGRANLNWAIINGEKHTAISIHTMAPEIDAGGILFQQNISIGKRDTVGDLYDRLNEIQRHALADAVLRALCGDRGRKQDERKASYCCTRIAGDGEIDWSATTTRIDRLIRALAPPYPGAFTYVGTERLIVWKAEPLGKPPRFAGRVPGRVVAVSKEAGHLDVLTGDGVLRLLEVQRGREARTTPATIIRSTKATLGLRTSDLLGRLEALEQQLATLTRQG